MLYPEARAAVDLAARETPVHTPGLDLAAVRAAAREESAREPREDVAEVLDLDADGVACRLYRPAGASPGLVVHLHGGGFVLNDVEVHDPVCRRFANRLGRAVLSVDYRLAPEHPFPAPVEDVDTVLAWLARESSRLGLDGPLAVHGDSAGGNLALVAALRHPGRFDAVALVYPFLDPRRSGDSHATEVAGFDPRDVDWYWQQYAGGSAEALTHPDLAPLEETSLPRLASLPPTFVASAEHDPLREEGERVASLAVEAGVHVVAVRCLGQVHGFWRHDRQFPAADVLVRQVAAFLTSPPATPAAGG